MQKRIAISAQLPTERANSRRNNNKSMKIPEPIFNRIIRPSLFVLLLLPFVYFLWGIWQDALGANPLEAVIRGLGDWALRILLLTLSISPLRRLLNWPQLLRLRRMLGLFAYFYVVLHLLSYLWVDQFFDWAEIWYDILERPFITVGMISFLLLTPLAVTSTKGFIRRMGKNWKRLHSLIYPISMLTVLHFWWMAKLDKAEPALYAGILSLLLLERIVRKYLK